MRTPVVAYRLEMFTQKGQSRRVDSIFEDRVVGIGRYVPYLPMRQQRFLSWRVPESDCGNRLAQLFCLHGIHYHFSSILAEPRELGEVRLG